MRRTLWSLFGTAICVVCNFVEMIEAAGLGIRQDQFGGEECPRRISGLRDVQESDTSSICYSLVL